MSIIKIMNMNFSYISDLEPIFEDVNLNLDTGWRLGLIGRNGRGKTTLLRILNGELEYDGSIVMSEYTQYFPKRIEDYEANTIDVLYELYPDLEFWKVLREMNYLKVEEDVLYRPFSTLSNGEQTKVQLAALFSHDNDFLLLDEVTNHLDAHGREMVADYIATKSGFILVSHDRDFLDRSIDHVLSINRNTIDLIKGNYSTWEVEKEREDNYEIAKNAKLKSDINKLTQTARQQADWSNATEKTKIGLNKDGTKAPDRGFVGAKAAKMMKRSLSTRNRIDKAIEDKSKLLKNIETMDDLTIMPLTHNNKVLFRLHDFQIAYDEPLFTPVDFEFGNGDILSIRGDNGTGKSSLIKALLGEDIPYSGEIQMANDLIVSYLPQDFSHLKGDIEDFVVERDVDRTIFFTVLRKLDFPREQFIKDMSTYSSGQKKKVLMAASIAKPAHLYIWDEPLNFIDVFTRIQIENMILEYAPSMVIIEHDRRFVESVVTREIFLEKI